MSSLDRDMTPGDAAALPRRRVSPGCRRGAAAALGAAIVLSGAGAEAQLRAHIERLDPPPPADGFFSVPAPGAAEDLRVDGALVLSFARSPLSLRTARGHEDLGAIVDHSLVLHALVGLQAFRRVVIDVDVPSTLTQGGGSPVTPAGITLSSPSGAAIHDVRAGARVLLLRQSGLRPSLAARLAVFAPSGDKAAYTGTGTLRYTPALILGAESPRFSYSLMLGRHFQPTSSVAPGQPVVNGGEVVFGIATSTRVGPVAVNGEIAGATVADRGVRAFAAGTTSVELLVGARYALGPVTFGLAGGPGILSGVGTPAYRLLFSVGAGVSPKIIAAAPHGAAAQGTAEVTGAAAAAKPPPATRPLPPPDKDGDGVPDAEDACPARVGIATPGAPRRGCPPDRDGDGIADIDDRCPDEAGVASSDPLRYGCPADSDGDGIPDALDACPADRGQPSPDPKKNGCPRDARIVGEAIAIMAPIEFATGSDAIDPRSYPVLENVAQIMRGHPDIARVAVDGHTDNVGDKKQNVLLSQRRALSVMRWLTEHGVDPRRLEAEGFGPNHPIDKNDTEAGRAKNRRVEFHIKKRDPRGEKGWFDGPVAGSSAKDDP